MNESGERACNQRRHGEPESVSETRDEYIPYRKTETGPGVSWCLI